MSIPNWVAKLTIFCVILIQFLSCKPVVNIPIQVQIVLKSAGNNRNELEKVIYHYSNKSDSLKLAATYFLIKNMQRHYSYKGKSLDAFDGIFEQIEKHERKSPFIGNIHFPTIISWSDSIIRIHGLPHPNSLQKVFDHTAISAEMLIKNIDCAFIAWQYPWAKHLNFDQFCNYILPYRFQDESLESWRPLYMKKFNWLLDSMQNNSDPVNACRLINNNIKKWFRFNEELSMYPSAISPLNLLKAKMGRCLDQAGIANFAMRAMGIPVVHEVIPQWGDRSMGHDFSSVLNKEGKFIDFLGGELDPGKNDIRNKAPKIYRQMYPVMRPELSAFNDGLSVVLGQQFGQDVTTDFVNATDVLISKKEKENKNVFLAVFDDNRWVPVDLAKNTSKGYFFEKMGHGIVYLPCTIDDKSLTPISDPLYIDNSGKINYIKPEKKVQTVNLDRKYPMTKIKLWWMTLMGGGKFEGSNKSDFSDRVELFVVADTISLKYHLSKVKTPKRFRFVRYLFPDNCFGSLGELAFYESTSHVPAKGIPIRAQGVNDEDLQIAFDGKLDKFIHTSLENDYNGLWIGLDFGKPQLITKVGYSPRNDQNNIEEGMEYELFYWDGEWRSLGKKIASSDHLIYNNTPRKALLLLQNYTAGKEERIFLYENGKQVWF